MTHSSDLKERLPAFKEIMQSVNDAEKQGGFEGVPSSVLDFIKGAEPVGINSDGEIHLSNTYEPENGPPLLVLRPGESGEGIHVMATDGVARTATRLLAQVGWEHTFSVSDVTPLKIPPHVASHSASTVSTSMNLTSGHSDEDAFTMQLPRIIRIGGNHPTADTTVALSHELSHWAFYLHEAGELQNSPGKRLDDDTVSTITERQAYEISYRIERNLGYHALLKTPAELAEHYRGLYSFRTATLHEGVCNSMREAGVADKLSAALTALTLTELYTHPDTPATEDEVLAYRVTGLI